MVVMVKLTGLNVRQSRGKWYVSLRRTGESIVKGFVGNRAALEKHLATDAVIARYNRAKTRDRRPVYDEGTLGALVEWFKVECPRWKKLRTATQKDYEKSFLYLEPEFDTRLDTISQADIYDVRDQAAQARWGRFADKLVSHLSTMFREAVKKRKMALNPALGVERVHTSDPNANHEWTPAEVDIALDNAPRQVLTVLVLARYQGFRGQTIRDLSWRSFVDDAQTGKAFDLTLRKNDEMARFPCEPETRAHLESIDKTSTFICTNRDGKPWKNETTMQGAVSDYLAGLKDRELIRPGCTLHGLRVTFAAAYRRLGLDTKTVADILGDRSAQMGAHYTRHVEKEVGRMRAWKLRNGVQNG